MPPLPGPETATPERPTVIRPGVVRIDRIGLELGSEGKFAVDIKDDDPLSASIEMQRTQTIRRDAWQVRIETAMRLSCTRDAFRLRASLRAWEGDERGLSSRLGPLHPARSRVISDRRGRGGTRAPPFR